MGTAIRYTTIVLISLSLSCCGLEPKTEPAAKSQKKSQSKLAPEDQLTCPSYGGTLLQISITKNSWKGSSFPSDVAKTSGEVKTLSGASKSWSLACPTANYDAPIRKWVCKGSEMGELDPMTGTLVFTIFEGVDLPVTLAVKISHPSHPVFNKQVPIQSDGCHALSQTVVVNY